MLKGKQAKETLKKILSDANGQSNAANKPYCKPYVTGYFKSDNMWVAFDNTTCECWTEEFKSDKAAEKWCAEANPESPIIVKQLLDHIDYGTLYELWDEHVNQLSDPPDTYELINQLSDLIDVDADVCKAVADKIAKDDEPTTPESPIIVTINGGCVYAVDGVPSDKTVEVRDYDIQDDTSDDVKEDDDGEKYILSVY